MGMKYYKLFDMMNRKGIKRSDLLTVITAPIYSRLKKGEGVRTEVLCRLCDYLHCQPGDIMEYIPDDEKEG